MLEVGHFLATFKLSNETLTLLTMAGLVESLTAGWEVKGSIL